MWITEEGKTAVAHADAQLTFSNRRELQQLATDAFDRGARTVVVDLGETGYVDTAALGMLAMLASRLRLGGAALHLANVNADVRATLAAAKLDGFLPISSPEHTRAD